MVTVMVMATATATVMATVTATVMVTVVVTVVVMDPETDRVMGLVVGLVMWVIRVLFKCGTLLVMLLICSVWLMPMPPPTSTLLSTMDLLPPVIFWATAVFAETLIPSSQA